MINLITTYFTAKQPERKAELDTCMNNVISSGLFSSVTVLVDEYPVKLYDGCVIEYLRSRPSYNAMFEYAKPDAWNVFSNTDIYFDDTIKLIERRSKNEFIALTRYDVDTNGKATFFNRWDSQDVWCFYGKPKPGLKADFTMGTPGCDNVIARIAKQSGYTVTNPSKTIKTYHLHNSGIRNYNDSDRLPGPYELITPHL